MAYLPHIDDPSIFCDSTVFSDSYSSSSLFTSSMSTELSPSMARRTEEKSSSAKPNPTGIFPVLPTAHNFSALGNPRVFGSYIKSQLPAANGSVVASAPSLPPKALGPAEKRRRKDQSKFLNNLLETTEHRERGTLSWVEKIIFPDAKLPVQFNEEAVADDPTIWNEHKISLARSPREMTDGAVRIWLNNIADNLASAHKISRTLTGRSDRAFDSSTATRGPTGSYEDRKPDICAIDRIEVHDEGVTAKERLHWRKVYAIIEVTKSSRTTQALANILKQISQKSACIFDVQPQRRFTCAIGIIGEPSSLQFVFVLVDRSGMLVTPLTPLTSSNAFIFLRIIFAFCFASPEALGWDPSMILNPITKEVTSIAVTGCECNSNIIVTRVFKVVKLLHSSPVLYSRGTRVWIVRDEEGKFCILKDSWTLADTRVSEIEFVQHIERSIEQNAEGYLFQYSCPTYCIGQEVVWSTDTVRGRIEKHHIRHQRRIVTGPIGDPITSFRSKKEFVGVFLDIVNCKFLSSLYA